MAINFPDSPTTGQTFTSANRTWVYNGTSWIGNYSSTGSADTLDGIDSSQFLRSDTDTTLLSGNLTLNKNTSDTILNLETDTSGIYDTVINMGSGQNDIDFEGFQTTDHEQTLSPLITQHSTKDIILDVPFLSIVCH